MIEVVLVNLVYFYDFILTNALTGENLDRISSYLKKQYVN